MIKELIYKQFHLFSTCIPVKGVKRSIIYDLERASFEYIPNGLFEILKIYKNTSISVILNDFNVNERGIIIDYFNFLYEKEFIFFSNLSIDLFPKLNIESIKPYNISTLIIDFDFFDVVNCTLLEKKINDISVECLIFRFLKVDFSSLSKYMLFFNLINVRNIQIFIDSSNKLTKNQIKSILNINQRISIVLFFNAKEDKYEKIDKTNIISLKRNVITISMIVKNVHDFDVNMSLYMESKLFNNYFNKKLYVDLKGFMYNDEYSKISFGNFFDLNISSLLSNKDFTNLWNISKDKIKICKDCEYRYMCVDSRIPIIQEKDGLWILEKECNYNPYKAEWK